MTRFESLPGRGGRWLVRDRGRCFTVPADLGARLREPDGVQLWRELAARRAAGTAPPRHRRGIWLCLTLLPARLVRRLARPLQVAASWPALGLLAGLGLAGVSLAWDPAVAGGATWTTALPLFVLTVVIHELGHAAALSREGWPPGSVGVGLLWVLPVMLCDVSAATLLPRSGRARVDLAGVGFQLAAVGLLAVIARFTGLAAGMLAVPAVMGAIIWSLLPLARTDGYWLACDLLGLPDLEARPLGPVGRRRRLAIAAWRLLTIALLLIMLVAVPWRLLGYLEVLTTDRPSLQIVTRAVLGVVVLMGVARALPRVGRTLAALRRDWSAVTEPTVVPADRTR